MFRIAVISGSQDATATIRVLRRHVALSVAELRERVLSGRSVAAFELVDLDEIRRCRALLHDLRGVGARVQVREEVDGAGEAEASLEYLRNVMRRNLQTRRQLQREDELRLRPGEAG
jgi:hypothetical protein